VNDILKDPPNTPENHETLANIFVNDLSKNDLKEIVKMQFLSTYKISKRSFLKDYYRYFEETGGHCPFRINSD